MIVHLLSMYISYNIRGGQFLQIKNWHIEAVAFGNSKAKLLWKFLKIRTICSQFKILKSTKH